MPIASTVAIAAASALIKKPLDDLYASGKSAVVHALGRSRSDLRDITIARALYSITKVKTLWNIDKAISLYEFYYPSSICFADGVDKKIKSVNDFGEVQNYVIQGTAGQGKSIFLRYLCGQELVPSASSGRIPIFIELRRLREDANLADLILQALTRFKLPDTPSAWSSLAGSGKFVLLCDAFDEIEPALVDRTIAEIEQVAHVFADKLQIIVTSRPDADIQKSDKFRVCRLSPLQRSDQLPFLRKICSDQEQATSLHKVVQGSPADVSDLLTTPLMLTLLVILYKSLQTVPDTVPKFYEELFDVLFYRHDNSKPGFRRKRFTQLDDSVVKDLFAAFCFYVRLQRLSVLTGAQMRTCCEQASIACNQPIDPTKFRQEMTKTVCLMQEEGFEISFIHKSVTQYYAASFVSRSSDRFAQQFYELARKQSGWELELKFLSKIDEYRFMRLYELPLLKTISTEVGFSLEKTETSDPQKVTDYIADRLVLVTGSMRDSSRGSVARGEFLGWQSNARNEVLDEISFPWMGQVIRDLNKRKGATEFMTEVGSAKHLVRNYIDLVKDTVPEHSQALLDRLRARHAAAQAIIRTEEQKTDMLSAFSKSVSPRPHEVHRTTVSPKRMRS